MLTTILSYILLAIVILIVLSGIKILYQYERGVVFTLGRYTSTRNPGLTVVIPVLQVMRRVDMRIKTADIPRQEVITKDNIPLLTNAVVYFKVVNPADAIIKIEDYVFAVRQYTQAALRDVIGNAELDFVLTERERIAESIKKIVDAETAGWGVDLEAIKIQEIELPAEMKRAMAKQAEAERFRESDAGGAESRQERRGAAPAHIADHPRHRGRPVGEDRLVPARHRAVARPNRPGSGAGPAAPAAGRCRVGTARASCCADEVLPAVRREAGRMSRLCCASILATCNWLSMTP